MKKIYFTEVSEKVLQIQYRVQSLRQAVDQILDGKVDKKALGTEQLTVKELNLLMNIYKELVKELKKLCNQLPS